MLMKIKTGVCLVVLLGCVGTSLARINFGSKQSAFKFSGSTKLTVPADMLIDTGTIARALTATFEGAPIRFSEGILGLGATDNLLTGKYDYDATTYAVILDGDKSFYAQPGITTPPISVSGTGNRLEGDVYFDQSNAISFADADTVLTMALKSGLNKSIALNGGTLTLENQLALGDDVVFSGAGTVKGYSNCLFLGGKALTWPTGTINWKNSTILCFNSDVTLQGRWNFYDTCYIIGNGNILDISAGKLRVMSGCTLYLADVKVKGVNTTTTNIEFDDRSSQIKLNDAELELDDDWTLTIGGVYVENSSTIITKSNILTFDLGSSLTVDGCVLWYEPLSSTDLNNIQPSSASDLNKTRLTLLDGGIVKAVKSYQSGGINIDSSSAIEIKSPRSFYTLLRDPAYVYELSAFTDVSDSKPVNVNVTAILDGGNNVLTFGSTTNPLINIAAGVTLTFENIGLERFLFNHLNLANSTAHVLFGDKTQISLATGPYELTGTYTFQGSCVLNGNNGTLTLGQSGGFDVEANSSLLIQNITIKGLSNKHLQCLDNTATISFGGNVTVYLSDDYFFEKGRFELLPASLLDVHGTYSFVYESPKRSFIYSGATLQMADESIFYYNPSIANRNLIVFNDEDANLRLNNGTLASTTTGMWLTRGCFQIYGGNNYIENQFGRSLSEGIMLGDGVSVANNVAWEFSNGGTVYLTSGLLIWFNLVDLT